MMKSMPILACVVAATALTCLGETNKVRKVLSDAEREARRERGYLRRTGGTIRREGSAKGQFVVLNAQKRVPAESLRSVMAYLENDMAIRCKLSEADNVTIAGMAGKIGAEGGSIGVALVDDKALPPLLTAPETRWSIVNVAKLGEHCKDEAALAARVRREILRSLAFTSGCAYMTMGDPLMRDVAKTRDLDGLQDEAFGVEIVNRFQTSAPLYGLKPWHVSTYREACEEGWAPAPTNEFQKAIWDKVHAMPTEPIKILPETKKVRD